jgi:hypothetical protein
VELVVIEWKLADEYDNGYLHGRLPTYRRDLDKPTGPIVSDDPRDLFYDPFYQFLRGTLLAWWMVQENDGGFGASAFTYVSVAPQGNNRFRQAVVEDASRPAAPRRRDAWAQRLRPLPACPVGRRRHRSSDVPIIILSGKAEHTDRVRGLERGADDYITTRFRGPARVSVATSSPP